MSLMSSSLLLQQCLICFVYLIWMVLEIEDRWLNSCCLVGSSFQNLFNIARSSLMLLPSSFFSIHLVSIPVVYLYSRINTNSVGKKLHLILLDKSDFHMIDNLLIAVPAFVSYILMSFSVNETLLPRYMNLSTNFREPQFSVDISPFWLKTCTPFCQHSHKG